MKAEKRLNVRLLSDVCMQSKLLKDALEQQLPIAIDVSPFGDVWQQETDPASQAINIIIIDYACVDTEALGDYFTFKQMTCPEAKEVVINCPPDVLSKALFRWQRLSGVFYVQDDIDTLIRGMHKILNNEMWLTRKLTQEYIMHYRSGAPAVTSQVFTRLTRREQQIIKLLASGASNIEIAAQLYVSENTVKTHLHNVFKKINAKNRLQALIWAKSNIGMEEVS